MLTGLTHHQLVMEHNELKYLMTDHIINLITNVVGIKLILSKCMSYTHCVHNTAHVMKFDSADVEDSWYHGPTDP